MQVVAQGWLVLDLTDSPFWVGAVSALGSLPILFFTLWGGVVADRVHRRRALILLQSLMLADALALATLTVTGHITLHWVMLLAAIHGTSTAFEVPIRQAFVLEMVDRDDLMNAIALNSSNFNLTRILGPALAGGIIATFGVAPCFFLNAASFLAAIGSFLAMTRHHQPPAHPSGPARAGFREGLDYVWGREEPRSLLLLTAVYSVFGFSFIPMLPVLARDVLGKGAVGYGLLMTSVGVGASAGALAMASLGHRLPAGRLLRLAGVGFGVALTVAAASRSWGVVVVAVGLAGFSMILNNVTSNTRLQTHAPDHLRGRVMGFYSMMVLGVAPAGALQAGWVSEHLGVPASLLIGAVACVAGLLLLQPGAGADRGGVSAEEGGTTSALR
jgi:MFS family permease